MTRRRRQVAPVGAPDPATRTVKEVHVEIRVRGAYTEAQVLERLQALGDCNHLTLCFTNGDVDDSRS